jgi:PKD repeat protein
MVSAKNVPHTMQERTSYPDVNDENEYEKNIRTKSHVSFMRGYVLVLTILLLMTALRPVAAAPNHPPVADAGDDQRVKVGTYVHFGASGSSDPDGDSISYKWDFDASNGLQTESSMIAPTHVYSQPGVFKVTLTVSDGKANSSDTINITVFADTAPTVDLGPDISAEANNWIFFDVRNATDQDGDALTYKWDFDASDGIGVDSTEALPEWKYNKVGIFTVTLTVSDGKFTVSDTVNVTVAYNFERVSIKGLKETKTLKAGQKMIYDIPTTKGKGLEVTITDTNGTILTTYLFESENYFKYTQTGGIVALSKATKENFTKFSYSIAIPKSDDFYLVIQNPSSDPKVYASFDISIKISSNSGSGFIPGPGAMELVSSIMLVALVLAMVKRRNDA